MRNTNGSTLAYSLLVIGIGVLFFIIHEQKDDLRNGTKIYHPPSQPRLDAVLWRFYGGSKWGRRGWPLKRIIKTISVVSKTLHKKQKTIEKQYDNLVEAANRLALTVESDHNIIADSHEYIHRNGVFHSQSQIFF